MADVNLKTAKREVTGKAVKALRADGWVPGVMYGQGKDAVAIQANERELDKVYHQAGTSKLVEVSVGEAEATSTLFYDVQKDPLTDKILHFDLYMVKMDEKIHTEVPIHFINESPVVIAQQGELMKNLEAVEIEALPRDLPEHLEVDLAKLTSVGDSVSVGDLDVPAGVEIQVEPEVLVVKLEELRETDESDFEEVEDVSAEDVESEHGAAGDDDSDADDGGKGDDKDKAKPKDGEAAAAEPAGEDKKAA